MNSVYKDLGSHEPFGCPIGIEAWETSQGPVKLYSGTPSNSRGLPRRSQGLPGISKELLEAQEVLHPRDAPNKETNPGVSKHLGSFSRGDD